MEEEEEEGLFTYTHTERDSRNTAQAHMTMRMAATAGQASERASERNGDYMAWSNCSSSPADSLGWDCSGGCGGGMRWVHICCSDVVLHGTSTIGSGLKAFPSPPSDAIRI